MREMAGCLLSEDDIRQLNRDLQILVATNGTLTRILSVVVNDEIVVEIIKQQTYPASPKLNEVEELPTGEIFQRQIMLRGRASRVPYVAAESLIAVDLLPPAIMSQLKNTEMPLGEALIVSRLETFKESAAVWIGEIPTWVTATPHTNKPSKVVARRYRIMTNGQPLMTITEYFLEHTS
jgi:chorismate lyase